MERKLFLFKDIILVSLIILFSLTSCETPMSVRKPSKEPPPPDAFSGLVQIIDHEGDDMFPAVSRDGELVSYVAMKSKGSPTLFYFNPLQKGNISVSQAVSSLGGDSNPVWGTGRDLYFDSSRLKTLSIWKTQVGKGRSTTQITNRNTEDFYPDISPDGKSIVFNSSDKKPAGYILRVSEKIPAIWISEIDGSNITLIGNGWKPRWTPDGKKILFVSPANNQLQVWMMNPDGSEVTQITTDNSDHIDPIVSRDMTTLFFAAAKEKGNYDIWAMNLQGEGLTQLTFHPANDISPAWSPKGELYFCSNRSKDWDIWVGKPIIPWTK